MKDISFEEALQRLETVVEAMEGEEATLESSLMLYKEGLKLSQRCDELLNRFEAEINVLQKQEDGSFTEESYA